MFELQLVTSCGWRVLQRCLLLPGERGVSLASLNLRTVLKNVADAPASEEGPEGMRLQRKAYVAVGTALTAGYGEDVIAKGRVLLFEVEYVATKRAASSAPNPATTDLEEAPAAVTYVPRLKLVFVKELKGIISALVQRGRGVSLRVFSFSTLVSLSLSLSLSRSLELCPRSSHALWETIDRWFWSTPRRRASFELERPIVLKVSLETLAGPRPRSVSQNCRQESL